MFSRMMVALVLVTGCGDNLIPQSEGMKPKNTPSASSSVGGAQVSRSKSFMLVTSVSTGDAKIQRNSKNTLQPGVGAD